MNKARVLAADTSKADRKTWQVGQHGRQTNMAWQAGQHGRQANMAGRPTWQAGQHGRQAR